MAVRDSSTLDRSLRKIGKPALNGCIDTEIIIHLFVYYYYLKMYKSQADLAIYAESSLFQKKN